MNKETAFTLTSNPRAVLMAFSALMVSVAPLSARTYDWDITGPGSYNELTNWSDNAGTTTRVPGSSDVFHVDNGGTLLITDADSAGDVIRIQIGTEAAESGFVQMDGGYLGTRDDLQIGKLGAGSFTMTDGVLDVGKVIYLAHEDGGAGVFNQSGGAIEVGNGFVVGNSGAAVYTMTGGTLDTLDSNVIIGNRTTGVAGAHGTLNQSSGQIDANQFVVGDGVAGTDLTESGVYNLSGDAVLNANQLLVGRSGSNGRVEMTGGTINLTDFLAIAHGSGAVASFNQSGGTVNKTSGISYVSRYVTGDANTASWTLSGSAVANLDDLLITQGISAGTLTLNGGTLSATQIRSEASGAGTSLLNLNGGTIVARADNATFLEGLTETNVQSGGVTFDTDGNDITIAQDLLDDGAGDVIKAGTGELTFSGDNTYLGDTVVQAGSLILADGGSMTFAIGAAGSNNMITGTGTVDLSGLLIFDFENLASSTPKSWTIVDSALTASYGETFSILSFTEAEAGIWTYDAANLTYTFSESTGILSAVPEPAQFALLMGFLVVGASVMRRKPRAIV
ncbi:autotransporter-associated beta strand repeat-containing protein [Coraliomargarita sp. W4R53]